MVLRVFLLLRGVRTRLSLIRYLPAEYLGDCIDACVMAIRSGLTVKQVPVEMRERQGGTPSSSPWKSAVYLVRSFFSFGMSMTRQKTNVGSK